MFDTYLLNFANGLYSPGVLACFQEADMTPLIRGRYDVPTFANYHN